MIWIICSIGQVPDLWSVMQNEGTRSLRADLLRKYDVPTPRYTSYPTVPYWNDAPVSAQRWEHHVREAFDRTNSTEGISLYLHLPFCEKLCTYCGCNKRITKDHRVEEPYITALIKEWDHYLDLFPQKPRIAELHLGGGTPTFFSAANLDHLLSVLREGTERASGAVFSVEVHPNATTADQLQVMHDHGFRRISVGIQDFAPNVQFIINRIQTFERTRATFDAARNIGYTSINADLIYGLPLQTAKNIEDTIEKVNELRPDRIAFYSYAHVPWKSKGQRRYDERDLPSGEVKRNLYELGCSMLENAGYVQIGMDHFALPGDELFTSARNGTMHRNFMGYTPRHTELLIGLGASSISDTGTAFMQNVKEVEAYEELVMNGSLPILKGHELTDEDVFYRKHIQDLMCRDRTSWRFEDRSRFADAIARLRSMEGDGLVELGDDHIQVLAAGRPFVRNIAMCLDARSWASAPATQLFSRSI